MTKGWFFAFLRMKVAMKPLLLTFFDSKGEQPPPTIWGGVLVINCLGYEEFLKKTRYLTKIFLSIDRNECSI